MPQADPLYEIAHSFDSGVGLNLGSWAVAGIPYYPVIVLSVFYLSQARPFYRVALQGNTPYSINCIHYFEISPHFTDKRRRSNRWCLQSQYSLRIMGRRILRAHWSTVSNDSFRSDRSIVRLLDKKSLCDLPDLFKKCYCFLTDESTEI